MASLYLDRVHLSSFHESFKNHSTQTATITVSGTIAAGGTTFTTTVPFVRTNVVAEIYVQRSGDTYRTSTDNLQRLPYGGATPAYLSVRYGSSNVTIAVEVGGTGAPSAATATTYTFTVVLFDAPITF